MSAEAVSIDTDGDALTPDEAVLAMLEFLDDTYGDGWHGNGQAGYMRCRRLNGAACAACRKGRGRPQPPPRKNWYRLAD